MNLSSLCGIIALQPSKRFTRIIMKIHILLLSLCLCATSWGDNQRAETDFAKLPEACQKMVRSYGENLELLEVEFEREGSVEVYEVEFVADGRMVELEMTSDGQIVKIEESVPYNELPEALKKTIDWSPDSKRAIKITKKVTITYEVQIEGLRGERVYNALGKERKTSYRGEQDDD